MERPAVPAPAYFLVSAVFHFLGPSFAVLLFARVQVLGVAWLRIASAAVILGLWRRPWRAFAALDGGGRALLLAWGALLAVMNACFYNAISRLALGTVAAIEFLPVIVLAALGARSARNFAALGLAAGGVYLLTDVPGWPAPPSALRSRLAPRPSCSRSTSSSPTGWPSCRGSAASTVWPPRC